MMRYLFVFVLMCASLSAAGIREELQEEHQYKAKIAEFYGYTLTPDEFSSETYLVTFKDFNFGVCQICWYSNGYTITCLNGEIEGRQFVVLDDKTKDTTYSGEKKWNGSIKHDYSWGSVSTFYDHQTIYFENDGPCCPPPCP